MITPALNSLQQEPSLDHLYGLDNAEVLMVPRGEGRSWRPVVPPAPVHELDPVRPRPSARAPARVASIHCPAQEPGAPRYAGERAEGTPSRGTASLHRTG